MSARDLFAAGYTDLVSVVPPDGKLAPTTTLKPESRGKAPGIRRRDGCWVGYAFTKADQPTELDLTKWEGWGANVGLMGTHFPGLDLDIEDETLATLVVQEATRLLGVAPCKRSRGSRRLLVFRAEESFGRLQAEIEYRGQTHVVEWLGQGRQYLVEGTHPSGELYRWHPPVLGKWEPGEIPLVGREEALDFLRHLADVLEGRATVVITGDGQAASEKSPPQESLLAPDGNCLRQVVAAIPNVYPDRDSYIQMGCAIKAALIESPPALEIYHEWASRWEGGTNDPETVEADWNRMHPPFRVGWQWLQEQAEGATDYIPAQDEFEADPSATPPPDEPDYTPLLAGVLDFTDTWAVERLARSLEPKVRFVPETGHWHIWNGHAWAQDRRNEAIHLVRRSLVGLSAEIFQRAVAAPNEDAATPLYKLANALQSRQALVKAVPELQAHPRLTLTLDQFDADHWLLNTPGGIVDLRTGALSASDPSRLCSKETKVAPQDEEPVRWFAFLEEVTNGDDELRLFLQKQLGYALTGVTSEQTLSFIHGPPLTGKSVFIDAVGNVFGSYHENAPAETFASSKSDRHPTDLAKLAGARLVTAVETQEGRAWDTQRIKSITGGDTISARFMRQDFFDYVPTFKVIIVGNHEPEISSTDEAMMRRLHVVPFEHSPPTVDRLLSEKLKEEWPQILSWMIKGCTLWLGEGLSPPSAVLLRTARYRMEEDSVGLFLEECCVTEIDATVTRLDLYNRWKTWCYQQGEEPGTLKQLKRRFSGKESLHGFVDARLKDGNSKPWGYRGLRLKTEEESVV